MKKEKEIKLLKTFKGGVTLDELEVIYISKILTHVWNLGLVQSERWLSDNAKISENFDGGVTLDETGLLYLSKILTHLWNLGIVQPEQCLSDTENFAGEIDVVGLKKISITPITFNFWLTEVRRATVFKLENGETADLSDVSVDLARQVLKQLAGSWQSYFELRKKGDTEARPPRSKKEDFFQTMAWSSFSVSGDTVLVPGYQKKRITIKLGEYLTEQIRGREVRYLTLYRNRYNGEFNLSVVVATPAPKQIENPKFIRAIDLGAGNMAVSDSTGEEYLIPTRRPDKYWMPRIAQVEKRVGGCTKGSRAHRRRMKARRIMHEKSGNQKISYQRKLARALFTGGVQAIIIGKSKTRLGLAQSNSGTPDQHYGAQNTGYLFRQLLYIKEKAAERGITVIEISDPQRKGDLENAQVKFFASRDLLAQGCKIFGLEAPKSFTRKDFEFDQGKGGKPPRKGA